MYKKLTMIAATALLFTGCAKQVNSVNSVNNTTNSVMNTSKNVMNTIGNIGKAIGIGGTTGTANGTTTSSSTTSGNYSVGTERINIMYSDRTRRDYGKIEVVKYEKNPRGRTQLYLNSCIHPGIGRLQCGGYIYKVTKEGWNEKTRIHFGDKSFNNNIILASGRYYSKIYNSNNGKKYYAIGDFNIKPGVTNYVNLVLE